MKVLLTFLMTVAVTFGLEYRSLAIIPPNINYNDETLETFAQDLYDTVNAAVAEYNFSKNQKQQMYKIVGTLLVKKGPQKYYEALLPKKIDSKQIKQNLKEIKKDPKKFMQERAIQKLLIVDFTSKKVRKTLSRCKGLCNVTIYFTLYDMGINFSKQNITPTYQYDSSLCQLSDKSIESINKDIEKMLTK